MAHLAIRPHDAMFEVERRAVAQGVRDLGLDGLLVVGMHPREHRREIGIGRIGADAEQGAQLVRNVQAAVADPHLP